MATDLSKLFPRYASFDTAVPVWCATPNEGGAFHRFFDTSPFSPSGRYLALTRLPFEDRMSEPGDAAEVILVDLHTGEERAVAKTRGWDTQLGAQAQWGAEDSELFFKRSGDDSGAHPIAPAVSGPQGRTPGRSTPRLG